MSCLVIKYFWTKEMGMLQITAYDVFNVNKTLQMNVYYPVLKNQSSEIHNTQ